MSPALPPQQGPGYQVRVSAESGALWWPECSSDRWSGGGGGSSGPGDAPTLRVPAPCVSMGHPVTPQSQKGFLPRGGPL